MTEKTGTAEYHEAEVHTANMNQSETEARSKKEKAKKKFEDVKEKASETKERVSERVGETVSTAKKETRKTARAVADKTRSAGSTVFETISDNLIPTVMIATGAAWLTANIIRNSSKGAANNRANIEPPAFESEESDYGVRDKAKKMTRRARTKSRRTAEKTGEFVRHNPFYVAGAFAAMGALIGFVLPETRRENRLYDEVREELKHKTEDEGVEEQPPSS